VFVDNCSVHRSVIIESFKKIGTWFRCHIHHIRRT
jgi:hypothetical protein